MQKVLMSSCLIGERVSYRGGDARIESQIVDQWIAAGRVVPFCPEVGGGLLVPRPPAEIIGSNGYAVLDGFAVVLDNQGSDVTRHFVDGAQRALQLAKAQGARIAVLKDGSPSCGRTYIYNGQFRGVRKRGESGVTAALLQRNAIEVFNEHQIELAEHRLRELENRLSRGA
jgi:uncharacterized protein YbbK (DUF523 family)